MQVRRDTEEKIDTAETSAGIQDASFKDESTGSETCITSSVCDYTFTEDLDLRSLIEEEAFKVLSQGLFVKRPKYAFNISEPDEDSDFLSLNFPRKLWKLVESEKFKSIGWDEAGTSIVINEELFIKEVLERKSPCRIFETTSMQSLVRQLNLYGFSKLKQTFQRSASLADFLAEENEASVLNKLQFYRHPNFKRGYPQLLVRMKRRVRIKKACPVSRALVPSFSKRNHRAEDNLGDLNSGLLAESSEKSLFSSSPNLTNRSTCRRIANTTDQRRSDLSSLSLTSCRSSELTVINQHAVLHPLRTMHMLSNDSYTQATDSTVNFVTTATSQYHIMSPLQNNYVGVVRQPSMFLNVYPAFSSSEAPVYNVTPTGNPRFSMPVATDASGTLLARSVHQPSAVYQHHPNYN
ncbi:PREDICTED: heat shock transcription factor, Y-linked-like [Chinchilla lanigera]|uniref:heat shock transcription factor, Y-linked-like n=1 Tax=Chinchilla lanigera TaxID=34839 RepID=UPI00038EC706|nr:PREDICTED: heat shock transcription factor, Y-linked-like [Chinchilla lanigera]